MKSRKRRKPHRKNEQKTKPKPPFWSRLLSAIPLFLVAAGLTFFLNQVGTLNNLETIALDAQMRLQARPLSNEVAIVRITDEDYRNLFGGKSPLDAGQLQRLIEAIASGNPKVIGVDIDTSASEFQDLKIPSNIPIVWGRNTVYSSKDEKFHLFNVLGGREPVPLSGLTSVREDPDGAKRRYQRILKTKQDDVPSLPWAVLKQANVEAISALKESDEEFFINYTGSSKNSNRISLPASQVLDMASGSGWRTEGIINGKILLLGGDYNVQDEHNTPMGWMLGVEVLANIIETDLQGGGKRPINRLFIFMLQLFDGILLLLLFQYARLYKAILLSMPVIIILSAIASLITYGTLAGWFHFSILLLAVFFQQIYDRFKDYRKALVIKTYQEVEGDESREPRKSN